MAYPTTPVIDNFNRADVDPIDGGWISLSGTPSCKIASNALAASAASFAQAYYSLLYAADLEVYTTLSVVSGQQSMMFRMNGQSSDTTKYGYELIAGANLSLYAHAPGGTTVLLGTSSPSFASGDAIGVRAVRSRIDVYYKAVAGSWTLQFSATDRTYSDRGYCLLQLQDTTGRFDDFGGGAVSEPILYWTRRKARRGRRFPTLAK